MVKHTLMAFAIAGSCINAPISAFSSAYLKAKIEDLRSGKIFAGIIQSGISASAAFAAIVTLVKTPAVAAEAASKTITATAASKTVEVVDAANFGVGVLATLAVYTFWRAWANFSELNKLDEIAYMLEELEEYDDCYAYDYCAAQYPEYQQIINYLFLTENFNVIVENSAASNASDEYDAYDAEYDDEDDTNYETTGTLYYVENV